MATSEEIERASLCTDLEYIAHELAQGRAASPQSVFTIQRAVEWIRKYEPTKDDKDGN